MSQTLGRGLDALLPDNEPSKSSHTAGGSPAGAVNYRERPKESVFWIETEKIRPNPEQPRKVFDESALQELAESIRQYGILQPIIVSKRELEVPNGTQVEYQLIAGERRYRAASILGLAHVPAIIRRDELSERMKLELALIENLQREDLNAIEKAKAYKRLVADFGMSQKEVGARVGKSREAVANTMRLLTLPDHIQLAISEGRISEGHARPLLSLARNSEDQAKLFQTILAQNLTVRDVERISRHLVQNQIAGAASAQDPGTRMLEDQLGSALGTRVSVKRARDGKGHIDIEFFSEEEFKAIAEKIAYLQAALRMDGEASVASVPSPVGEPSIQTVPAPTDTDTFTV
ncbi:MAG: hypothetical protein A3C84_01145 [Candidatus Ryanbacteria bacterium RIFCSPHIGHO2_02_FULL_48_12]|uniref:ParB-like N-terminal domain-containing protein n=1 Tax=Candidatus Ryanbacteria bacterium RIFCSPHIGHO2_01_FULL_48_27 TaxID=1802115 RepID=A0A1G2G413_9BACT|nr:MAG: hypothetical protein A2756_03655 [Candidatus Ryanbacteria bacterium RIFCSPHIGHO2_01_FULL_48_27]OGZ50720.1 MAG: hypothetical protein A3C84_01145 [Candidatus Ryanbacteria bacterium RIFCSPHIGHO2_02_FULL_48_12]